MEQNLQAEAKPIKIPGPSHPISIEGNAGRVIVSVAGHVIADTRNALTLSEAHYPAVQYIPRKDVDMALLVRSDRTTYCPYKGDASYFSIPVGGERSIDAVLTPRLRHQGPSRFLSRPRRRNRRFGHDQSRGKTVVTGDNGLLRPHERQPGYPA
jgi:uncharacterized protein (DUF427 family)